MLGPLTTFPEGATEGSRCQERDVPQEPKAPHPPVPCKRSSQHLRLMSPLTYLRALGSSKEGGNTLPSALPAQMSSSLTSCSPGSCSAPGGGGGGQHSSGTGFWLSSLDHSI